MCNQSIGSKFFRLKRLVFQVIQSFPKSKNNKPFLTLKNGRKMFFNIFIKKYGVSGFPCNYKDEDVARRIRLVEFFTYFVKDYSLKKQKVSHLGKITYVIESQFYKMIVRDIGKNNKSKLELLSFYHHK
ncbi:hypothetical protein COB57_00230 [Candidatus Peregrinibacteria bacterium]|nr:MAG: hypothetical protein COB57_00230 [Candidatus Peregrinibacteria bacterium]